MHLDNYSYRRFRTLSLPSLEKQQARMSQFRLYRKINVCILFCFIHEVIHKGMTNSVRSPSASEIGSHDILVGVYAPSNSTSTVAMCLVIKNATLYLDEWLDFPIALGFSPIFIYDNSPDFELMMGSYSGIFSWYDTRKDIHEYIRLIHHPVVDGAQVMAYDWCIKQDASNATFAALTDVDEFLVLKTFNNVVDFMDRHCNEQCGQLSINWRMMGTSNETLYRPVPILKPNVHMNQANGFHGTIKVIVRPKAVANHMHWFHSVMLNEGYNWVSTNGTVIKHRGFHRQSNDGVYHDVAILYHYAYRSEEEFLYKTCVLGWEGKPRHCNDWQY
mmetsp:Transcript_12037/g.25976  ORF Transcript_12037/g.25976 Transcript_12037/m.25976 type:complete len:331 (+) Transcript_12037:75-1067(+)